MFINSEKLLPCCSTWCLYSSWHGALHPAVQFVPVMRCQLGLLDTSIVSFSLNPLSPAVLASSPGPEAQMWLFPLGSGTLMALVKPNWDASWEMGCPARTPNLLPGLSVMKAFIHWADCEGHGWSVEGVVIVTSVRCHLKVSDVSGNRLMCGWEVENRRA